MMPLVLLSFLQSLEGMYQIDVGIAAQNIAVAAKSMGLDSVILGLPRVVFEGEIAENWKNKLQFPKVMNMVSL